MTLQPACLCAQLIASAPASSSASSSTGAQAEVAPPVVATTQGSIVAGAEKPLRIADKVALIKAELALEGSTLKDVLKEANEQLGLPSQGTHFVFSACMRACFWNVCMCARSVHIVHRVRQRNSPRLLTLCGAVCTRGCIVLHIATCFACAGNVKQQLDALMSELGLDTRASTATAAVSRVPPTAWDSA